MKNTILLIENNLSSVEKNSLFFEGLIYTKNNEHLENTILFKDSIFSLTLSKDYRLELKKLYKTLNIYYSEFINFSIVIENNLGVKKSEFSINSYFLDYSNDILKNITLDEMDIVSIKTTLYELSKFENKIYNKKSLFKVSSFKILNGTLTKLENKFINLKAISTDDSVIVSGIYSKNTDISISYLDTVYSVMTNDFGYFTQVLPLLPLGIKLKISSDTSLPHHVEVTHPLSLYSLKNSINIYSIYNIPCKLNKLTFDLYTRKFKVLSYSTGVFANFKDTLFSLFIFNEDGTVLLKKDFTGDATDSDLIDSLNNIEIKGNFYISLKSSYEIFKFSSQRNSISNITLYVTEKEIFRIIDPEISLDFNLLYIKSVYQNSNATINIGDTRSKYTNETGNLLIPLSKDLKYHSEVSVSLEQDSIKTLPVSLYTNYKNKNKAFLFNTNLNKINPNNYDLKDIFEDTFFLTSKYVLPLYFFEEGFGRISISTEKNSTYTLYLLNENKLEKLDTFNTNIQHKFNIPSKGIIFIDLKELQKDNTKIKVLFKPLDTCYRNLISLNKRDNIKESNIIFNNIENFKNTLSKDSSLEDSLVISKYFSVYIFNKDFFKDIDCNFSLFSNIFSHISTMKKEDFKEV
ncbi:MAG: hypothetical protein ACRC28_10205 [Clostridium sp.]|uniref:hypothetical protein n=1 Tax=Clostridium sp. TaxID=1506 RepID=UPI003F2A5DE7